MPKPTASLFALFFKCGGILLKLLKSVKALKVGLGAASLASYAWLFTPEFAVILVGALVIHEYGHLRAMKACGIPTKGIFLIPFFGGAAVAEEGFKTRADEAYVALMGPAWGLGTAVIPFALFAIYPSPMLVGVASFIALLNLFNLLPVNPLDGGRATKSIAFSIDSRLGLLMMFAGLLGIFAGMVFLKIALFLLIGFIAMLELSAEWYLNVTKHKHWLEYRKNVEQIEHCLKDSRLSEETKEYLRASLQNKKEIILQRKPTMTSKEIVGYFCLYLYLIIHFIAIIYFAAKVPGAELALKSLME
ncbi:site-2 protease family protein [Candidatus Parcubacteria bacterium]|nr:MAG: site-2 protease family protein [Candidatus Parcubacteria bacterium]